MTDQPSNDMTPEELASQQHAATEQGSAQASQAAEPAAQPTATGEPEMVVIRERKKTRKRSSRKKKRSGMPTGVKIAIGVVLALVIIAGSAAAFAYYNVNKGNQQLHEPTVEETGKTLTYKGETYEYNENVISVLVLGKDDENVYGIKNSCTDANVLVTLDTETKELNIIAIPRDSMVDVDLYKNNEYTRTDKHQLAVAYGVDVETEEQAAQNTLKSVSTLFYNMPLERYFVLDMDAVGTLATAVGGVKLKALETYPGAAFSAGETVVLEGEAALKYVKYRDPNVAKSAQDRQKRQMQFVKAFLKQLRGKDLSTIMDIYSTIQDSSHTNLDLSDISYLASAFLDGKNASTEFLSLKGTTKLEADDDGVEREHIYLDEDSVMETTLKVFYKKVD